MTRRLVVCADGTWNTMDQEDEGKPSPTNVVKMYEAVQRRPRAPDGVEQAAYYQDGVGAHPNAFEKLWKRFAGALHLPAAEHDVIAGATGKGIDANIKACYRWLAEHYEDGDDVYLFGFSRGAYTVRSLAGMIRNSGIVKDEGDVDAAYALYRDRDPSTGPNAERAVAFRADKARDVDVHCIGVWDTVGALGIPVPILDQLDDHRYAFHDVTLSSHVRHAYHALAIDERRRPFEPTLWAQQPDAPATQVLEQTWFPGVHCNVGGGYADCGLSDATFHWMVERAARAGLAVDGDWVASTACNANCCGVLEDSMSPIYKALRPYLRPIAVDDGVRRNEAVHDSAFERLGKVAPRWDAPYGPANLLDYVQRRPPSGGAPPLSGRAAAPAP